MILLDDPWKIKKVLKESDIGNMYKLLLGRKTAEKFVVLPVLADDDEVHDKEIQASIWDEDTNSVHSLIFYRWPSKAIYVQGQIVQRFCIHKGPKGRGWDWFSLGSIRQTLPFSSKQLTYTTKLALGLEIIHWKYVVFISQLLLVFEGVWSICHLCITLQWFILICSYRKEPKSFLVFVYKTFWGTWSEEKRELTEHINVYWKGLYNL